MELLSKKLIFSIGLISFLLLASGNSYLYAETKAANKSSSAQSINDYLLYATPSRLSSANNIFAAVSTPTCSSGSQTPTFKPGQVVSSDVFNEIFSRIDNLTEGFRTSSELVGTWSCTVNMIVDGGTDYCLATGFYSRDPSNFFDTMTDTVTFKDNGNGSYSYASARYPLLTCEKPGGPAVAAPESGKYLIFRHYMLMSPNVNINWSYSGAVYGFLAIQKISKYSFVLNFYDFKLIACDRLDIPPADPADLSASVSGMNVTLSWMNACNSTATSLKVLRKNSLTGTYSPVATLPASVTSYTQTVPAAGTYWYRIAATNAYGDSDGSNVADVTAE